MERKEFIDQVFETLEDEHINLYHDISKEEFEIHKNALKEICDDMDSLHFDAEMMKLFALFRDSHTTYKSLDPRFSEAIIAISGGNFYAKTAQGYDKIVKVNDVEIWEVAKRLSRLVASETDEWTYFEIADRHLGSITSLAMINVAKITDRQIEMETERFGKCRFAIRENKNQMSQKPAFGRRNYEFDFLPGNILSVKYTACQEHPDFTVAEFVEKIKRTNPYVPAACILDVRGNAGGSSQVIYPFFSFLERNEINTYVLMNEGTISGGRWAVYDAKKHLGATLLGMPTGGSAYSFGNKKLLDVNNRQFSASIKFFDMTDVFPSTGAIEPDVKIDVDIECLNKGQDKQFLDTVKFVQQDLAKNKESKIELGM